MKSKKKKVLIAALLIIALIGISVGVISVWKSFKGFEKSIIEEKDSQIKKRLRLEDANIQITIDNFIREAKNIRGKSIKTNPIYVGTLVYKDGKYVKELSSYEDCDFATLEKTKDFVICYSKDGQIYMAYKEAIEGKTYYQMMSLENLLNDIIGTEQDSEEMNFLMDCDGKIMIYKDGEEINVIKSKRKIDSSIDKCNKLLQDCVKNNRNIAESVSMTNEEGKTYTARMVIETDEKTDNEIFAIGKTSNYDTTIQPSMRAANRILLNGVGIVIGVTIILFVLFFLQKTAGLEIQTIRNKNKTLEEINQKMQALTHHQRLETIGTMTAGIAHDFNNLLTPIMGYSMMTMEKLPKEEEELQENLMEIYNATNKAKDIVTRLAELSRKGDTSNYENLDINELIRNAVKVSYPAKPKNVEVLEELSPTNIQIRGDKTQISQMILNFTLNAYDALSEKGGVYTIRTKHETDKISISFIDNGPGMDADTVSKIFDPFFTTKESGKGTGLGLAIIAQIAETHNAKVYVDSEMGKGTTFTVVFNS